MELHHVPATPSELYSWRMILDDDRPTHLITTHIPVSGETTVAQAQEVIRCAIATSSRLRSRMHIDGDAIWRQVLEPADAMSCSTVTVCDVGDADELENALANRPSPTVNPAETAASYEIYAVRGMVRHLYFRVHHLFCDGMGSAALRARVEALLRGEASTFDEGQADASYHRRLSASALGRAQAYWRRSLAGAPRSLTYRPMLRDSADTLKVVQFEVSTQLLAGVARIAEFTRTSPFAVWAAALSILAGGYGGGQHEMVFQTAVANRLRAEEAMVANYSQIIFMRLCGGAEDTFAARVAHIQQAVPAGLMFGVYDWADLMDWLDGPQERRGAAFRPAFALNYVARAFTPADEQVRIKGISELWDPQLDRAAPGSDLSLLLYGGIGRLTLRRPIWSATDPAMVFEDLTGIVKAVIAGPDTPVAGMCPPSLLGAGTVVWHGRTQTSVQLETTKAMLESIAGVKHADLYTSDDGVGLRAVVEVEPGRVAELPEALAAAQRNTCGAVIPDDLELQVR